MSTPLQTLSPRPQLLVDERGQPLAIPGQTGTIGVPGPFGGVRVVSALPLDDGPRLLQKPLVVHDTFLGYLGDADGNLIGVPGLWASRVISARWTANTRRIAG